MKGIILSLAILAALGGAAAAHARETGPSAHRHARAPAARPPSFDQLDVKGDGYLTPAEVKGTFAEKRFRKIDTNHDGRISRSEYLAALGVTGTGPSTFDRIDANHDGVISRDEASVDPPLAEQFGQTDSDRNGFVDRTEFSAFEAVQGASRGVDLP